MFGKKCLKIITLSIFLVLCSSCWDNTELNRNAIVPFYGIDLNDQDQLYFSALIVEPTLSESNNRAQAYVISETGRSIAEAARRLSLTFSRTPEWSHAHLILLGEQIARRDALYYVDFLTRNRFVRPQMPIVVSKDYNPEEIFSSSAPLDDSLGIDVFQLLKINREMLGIYVPVRKTDFLDILAAPGIEAALPQVTLSSNAKVAQNDYVRPNSSPSNAQKNLVPTLDGTAVFKGRQMIGSLNILESKGFRWLIDTQRKGGLLVISSPLDQNSYIDLDILRFSRNIKPQVDKPIGVTIDIKAELAFIGQQGEGELLTQEAIKEIEKIAAEEIRKQIAACIAKAQYYNSDILGWGRLFDRQEPETWQTLQSEWDSIFPQMPYALSIEVKVIHSLNTDTSFKFR